MTPVGLLLAAALGAALGWSCWSGTTSPWARAVVVTSLAFLLWGLFLG